MKKLVLSAGLVAGTSVGAGMIALPMVLCKIGVLPTFVLIIVLWFFMYLSGLLGLELNLRAGKGLTLGELGKLYSGPIVSQIGSLSLKFLIYALLCAYLYGGASIFLSFFETYFGLSFSLNVVILGFSFFLVILLSTPVYWILQINKFLLGVLLVSFCCLAFGLFGKLEFSHLPLIAPSLREMSSWTKALPILFTAFGFQVIFHTLTNFCKKDPILLKRSVFWGSLIPAVVYIIWTFSTLGILYHYAPQEYDLLLAGKLDVGGFIQALTETTAWPLVQMLTSIISIFAILKSSLGVGLGLFDAWCEKFTKRSSYAWLIKGFSLTFIILPPLMVSLFISELFLKALSFAGMILVIIAILLPLWLINCPKAKRTTCFYPIVESKGIQILFFMLGSLIIFSEIMNILS